MIYYTILLIYNLSIQQKIILLIKCLISAYELFKRSQKFYKSLQVLTKHSKLEVSHDFISLLKSYKL
jgi:hypothetical protein